MSEDNVHLDLQPGMDKGNQNRSSSETVLKKSESEAVSSKVLKSEENDSVKRGPPVAPKPAWFHQSLKGLRKANLGVKTQAAQNCPGSESIASKELQPTSSRVSARGASIKQRINSFESLSAPQSPEKPERRFGLKPSAPPEPSAAAAQAAAAAAQPHQALLQHHGASQQPPLLTSTMSLDRSSPSREVLVASAGRSNAASSGDSLCLPSTGALAASSPAAPAKAPSLRSRSFPLAGSSACQMMKPHDERCSKIYSISSQVSSALMKSLLCLPQSPASSGNGTWEALDTLSQSSAEEEGTSLSPEHHHLDTGFSLK